jgi:hypothetical protein
MRFFRKPPFIDLFPRFRDNDRHDLLPPPFLIGQTNYSDFKYIPIQLSEDVGIQVGQPFQGGEALACPAVFGYINDLPLLVQVLDSFLGK